MDVFGIITRTAKEQNFRRLIGNSGRIRLMETEGEMHEWNACSEIRDGVLSLYGNVDSANKSKF